MFGPALRLLAVVLLAIPSSGNVARDDLDPLKSEDLLPKEPTSAGK
jgi:hypothetical protein